jgi:16S rRNA (cytosine967-C5)-methyltransferase
MYVTCSLQKIEGERRIENFLQENENFSIIPFLQNEHPKIESCITENGFIRILPNHFNFNYKNVMNGSDGFFIALLKMEK